MFLQIPEQRNQAKASSKSTNEKSGSRKVRNLKVSLPQKSLSINQLGEDRAAEWSLLQLNNQHFKSEAFEIRFVFLFCVPLIILQTSFRAGRQQNTNSFLILI